MIQIPNTLTFTVPLSSEAHLLAQECREQLFAPEKAKQVYLNTLAVYAVDFYLRCLGLQTDAEQSDSRNPICLKFMDVGDLLVKGLGKLECRPVLPDAEVCQIPPEVREGRIGYVAVQLNRSLNCATILGFTPTAVAEVPLEQLRSLAEFPEYLNRMRQAASTQKATVTTIRNWFENAFEEGWQRLEAILETKQIAIVRQTTQLRIDVKRAKLLDLGLQLGEQSVALAIAISHNDDETVKVLVQVHPSRGQTYLPSNLRLIMLDENNETLQEVRSRSQDNYIQLKRFDGQIGDSFKIQVALNEISITEDFLF
jgi:hypothetical protein